MNASAPHLTPPLARTAWLQLAKDYPVVSTEEAEAVWDAFGTEMQQYCELLAGQGGSPVGLMFRGQGEDFTQRAGDWMGKWALAEADRDYLAEMAGIYQHTNAFLKLEWLPEGGRQIGVSYRRRPPLRRVLHHFFERGIDKEALQRILWIARVLQKETIHFVAASFRPGAPLRHKLYFSQYVTPDTYAKVVARILAVMEHFSILPADQNDFLRHHPQICPPEKEATLFLSFSFDQNGLFPHFKIDYPAVNPRDIQKLAGSPAVRPTLYEDLARKTGQEYLSYLGWRFQFDQPTALKYYADLYPSG